MNPILTFELVLPIGGFFQYSYLTLKAHAVGHSSEELDACRVVRVRLHCVDPDVIPEQGGRGVLFSIRHCWYLKFKDRISKRSNSWSWMWIGTSPEISPNLKEQLCCWLLSAICSLGFEIWSQKEKYIPMRLNLPNFPIVQGQRAQRKIPVMGVGEVNRRDHRLFGRRSIFRITVYQAQIFQEGDQSFSMSAASLFPPKLLVPATTNW